MTVCYSPNSNVRSRHTCIPFLPPIEVTAAYIPCPRLMFHTSSATLTPPQAPMCGQPRHNIIPALRLTISVCQSGLRRTASRGREIIAGALCHALANKLPVAPLHCATPRFAVHSDLLTFHQPQSPPLRTAPSLPHIATFNPFD